MDYTEKKKKLTERLAKAEEKAQKSKNELKELKKRIKALEKPDSYLTKKQDTSIKIWHGVACKHLMKDWPELAEKVREYLEQNVKSSRQRKIMGLTIFEENKVTDSSTKTYSKFFGRYSPVPASDRVDLVVPYPDPPEARQRAKTAGAKWDGKTWYVEKGFDLTLVEEFLPKDRAWSTYGII